MILGLDGQGDGAVLAIDAEELGLDGLAGLEHGAGVLDTVAGNLGGTQVTFHAITQGHGRAFGIHLGDGAVDHAALLMGGDEGREGILVELLDAQGDALALGVDGQHHGLQFVALLIAAQGILTALIPGDVGEMDQTVDAAIQADEDAEVGDGLDLAADVVALLVVEGEFVPGIHHALLDAQGDAAALLVDVEDHDLHLVPQGDDLGGMDILVGPVHLGDVDQALDALLDLDEAAIVGDVGDLAEDPSALGIAAGDVDPGVLAHLLEAQGDALAIAVELEDLDHDLVADLHHLGGVLDATPGHVGDVEQAVDAAQVEEGAVVGQVLDHALDLHALFQLLQ